MHYFLSIVYCCLDITLILINHNFLLQSMLAITIEKITGIDNTIIDISQNHSYLLRVAIIEMKLFDSKGDTEISCPKSSTESH